MPLKSSPYTSSQIVKNTLATTISDNGVIRISTMEAELEWPTF
jgi:hypothetical protein